MRARATHGRHDQVAHVHAARRRANFNHLTERLVANHKVVGAWRGSPIFEGADFLVCAANPNVEDTKFHLVGFSNTGSFMLDDPDLSGSWKNCNCFHLFDSSFSFFHNRRSADSPHESQPFG